MRQTRLFFNFPPLKFLPTLPDVLSDFLKRQQKQASDLRYWVQWDSSRIDSKDAPLFTNEHIDTLIFLVEEKRVSFSDAVGELNTLNPNQARALRTLYSHGLRNHHFSKMNEGGVYLETLTTLVCDEKNALPLEQAISEMDGLGWGKELLRDYYRYGLRKHHIKKMDFDELKSAIQILEEMRPLMQKNVLTAEQALSETADLDINERKMIVDYYSQGLRKNHILFMLHHNFLESSQSAALKLIKEAENPLTSEQIISKISSVLLQEFEKFDRSPETFLSTSSNLPLFKKSARFKAEEKDKKLKELTEHTEWLRQVAYDNSDQGRADRAYYNSR